MGIMMCDILYSQEINIRVKYVDRASNLITVCMDCHTYDNHQEGQLFHKWMIEKKKCKSYKEGPFMNSFRKRVFTKYPDSLITYGSMTTPRRKELNLEKTHYNDAIAISGVSNEFRNIDSKFLIKQFRKKKRSLHEATARKGRSIKNMLSKRNNKNTKESNGYFLNDKVRIFDQIGFISGFCEGGVYIKNILGNYITKPNTNYKQVPFKIIKFISHNNNWQFIPHL